MTTSRAGPDAKVLALRLASTVILVPGALAAVWYGPPLLTLVVALSGAAMAWEWGRLVAAGRFDARAAAIMIGIVAAMLAGFAMRFDLALVLAGIGAAAAALMRAEERWWSALGTLWIAAGCLAFLWLALPGSGGRGAVLWLLAVVWASDSLAFVAGKSLGGPKLAPRISPNKTWAGVAGGLIGAAMVGMAVAWIGRIPAGFALAVSLGLGVSAQAGDLVESQAKRHFAVKDTSRLIPGHGGMLDRLDGLIAAAIGAALLTLIFGGGVLEVR